MLESFNGIENYDTQTPPKAISWEKKLEIGNSDCMYKRVFRNHNNPAISIIGENGVVIVKSEEEFIDAMNKAKGNKHHLLVKFSA